MSHPFLHEHCSRTYESSNGVSHQALSLPSQPLVSCAVCLLLPIVFISAVFLLGRCAQGGVALTTSTYTPSEKFPPPPTIRITTNALHTREQLEGAVRVLAEAAFAELQ